MSDQLSNSLDAIRLQYNILSKQFGNDKNLSEKQTAQLLADNGFLLDQIGVLRDALAVRDEEVIAKIKEELGLKNFVPHIKIAEIPKNIKEIIKKNAKT